MSDYLNPNEGYYKVKRESKEPKNTKFILAIAAVVAVGGIIWFFNKSEEPQKDDMNVSVNTTSSANEDDSKMENSHNDVSHTEAAVTNLTVEAVEESLLSIDKIELQQFQDKITADGERKTYEISSSESGTYRFEFSNVPDNIYFKMFLYNADMEQLSYNDYLDNGDGITFDLNGDTKYYVVVEQQGNVGSYTLNVGSQKATKDISNITTVSDSIQFTNQRNVYSYTSVEPGTHRFEFSNVPDNIYFKMFLYNADMEQLSYNDYLDNGDGITFDLNGDTKYYVVVEQQGNVGSYTLNVGSQKATKDISNITTVSDSIQFTNQRNVYSYTSEKSGTYRFEFSNIPDNVYFKMFLYNADMEQFEFGDYLDNGDGITCDLIGSEQYYVVVEQQGYSGRYDMKIGPYIEN